MNFKPCADELVQQETSINVVVVEKTIDHQHEQKDDCAPFCSCACCSVRAHSATQLVAMPFISQATVQKPKFTLGHLYQISLPIWQPPQLV